jgi:thymidylate synthase (FAD)
VDYMGDDAAIANAARVSTSVESRSPSGDRSLIRYLMRHNHTSPFEMCEIKLHVRLPIFVARQWIRHRTASVNEVSGRYSELTDEFYVPSLSDIAGPSSSLRQGRGEALQPGVAKEAAELIRMASLASTDQYRLLLHRTPDAPGVELARELARIILPLNLYTEWYWKIDLHNLLHFLELRLSDDAQKEIRDYARVIATIVQGWLPFTFEAFVDYRLERLTLSRVAADMVRRQLGGEPTDEAAKLLSPGEQKELAAALGIHFGEEGPA